jgi:hypothetical protein
MRNITNMTQFTIVVRYGNTCQFVRISDTNLTSAMARVASDHPQAELDAA